MSGKETPTDRVAVSLRLPRALLDAIEERRRREYSTRHAAIIRLIQRGLEAEGDSR